MNKQIILIYLIIVVSIHDFKNVNAINKEKAIERKLKLLNKPAVKSIKSEDGDIIDCIDIYKQPAFDHPALKNHTIEMKPPSYLIQNTTYMKQKSRHIFASQIWKRSGSCPEGTIPIRRVRREDLLRASSLKHFGRKNQHVNNQNGHLEKLNDSKLPGLPNHSAAFLLTYSYNFITAQGVINVQNPGIDLPDDYSSGQIWLKHDDEFIESGWIVNPKLYGDTLTRFFVSWTADSHGSTGCFDHYCPGFVQVNKDIVLGASVLEVIAMEGQNTVIGFDISLDTNTGKWWLTVNEDIIVGYWPEELFKKLNHSAINVQWGGEVYSQNVFKSPHTETKMGSGRFSGERYGHAAFIENILIRDWSRSLKYPPNPATLSDEYNCYNALYSKEDFIPILFYGGPGAGGDGYYCI